MAGVTWWNFYFRLFPGSHPQPAGHRVSLASAAPHSRQVADRLGRAAGPSQSRGLGLRARAARAHSGWSSFPAYAPELNPVEYLWSHWKQHELPNFCPKTFGQLSHYARKALRRMRQAAYSGYGLLGTGRTLSVVTILCNAQ